VVRTARRGYDKRAVDAFLRRCAGTLGPRAAQVPGLTDVDPDAGSPRLDASDVRTARFPVVLRGYDLAEVDALLEQVAAALPGGERAWDDVPTGAVPEAEPLVLRNVLRGYDVREVDDFLTRCAHSLGSRLSEVPELADRLARDRTGQPLRARDVEVAQFRLRGRGYDVVQVDELLDRVARALER
jgi:DivIVA domain-containing protein